MKAKLFRPMKADKPLASGSVTLPLGTARFAAVVRRGRLVGSLVVEGPEGEEVAEVAVRYRDFAPLLPVPGEDGDMTAVRKWVAACRELGTQANQYADKMEAEFGLKE